MPSAPWLTSPCPGQIKSVAFIRLLEQNYLKISYLRYLFTYKPINTIVPFEEYRPSTTNPQYCTIGGCERTCSNSSSYDTAERWLLFGHSALCANLTI